MRRVAITFFFSLSPPFWSTQEWKVNKSRSISGEVYIKKKSDLHQQQAVQLVGKTDWESSGGYINRKHLVKLRTTWVVNVVKKSINRWKHPEKIFNGEHHSPSDGCVSSRKRWASADKWGVRPRENSPCVESHLRQPNKREVLGRRWKQHHLLDTFTDWNIWFFFPRWLL